MLAYSPMGRGILTGSFKPEDLPQDDFRRKVPGTYYSSENVEVVRLLAWQDLAHDLQQLACQQAAKL